METSVVLVIIFCLTSIIILGIVATFCYKQDKLYLKDSNRVEFKNMKAEHTIEIDKKEE